MIDPVPSIDLPGNPDVAEQLRAQDALVAARLKRMQVLVHLNTVARGHKAWADLNAPKTQDLVDYGQWLLDNPEDLGNQYQDILRQEIDQRIKQMIANMPMVAPKTSNQDAFQDCY